MPVENVISVLVTSITPIAISLDGHHFFPYRSPIFPLRVTQISLIGHLFFP